MGYVFICKVKREMDETKYFIKKVGSEDPFVFIDVGAMGGVSLKKWKEVLPIMKFVGFEPDCREFSKLENTQRIQYSNYLLHSKSQDLTLYITRGRGKTSIFKPNIGFLSRYEDPERFEVIKEETIPSSRVTTLDSFMDENGISDIDFLKIDTQGSELSILQGGRDKALPGIFAIQTEAEFVELYHGQPLFRDIDAFMDTHGYQLIDLRRAYWKLKGYYDYNGKGELIFADALYFKKLDIFQQEISDGPKTIQARAKIFKSILTCIVYGIFDYAISIARIGLESKCFKDGEYEDIASQIRKIARKGTLSRFHMGCRPYDALSAVLQRCKPRSYLGWADGDSRIGNAKASD